MTFGFLLNLSKFSLPNATLLLIQELEARPFTFTLAALFNRDLSVVSAGCHAYIVASNFKILKMEQSCRRRITATISSLLHELLPFDESFDV